MATNRKTTWPEPFVINEMQNCERKRSCAPDKPMVKVVLVVNVISFVVYCFANVKCCYHG